MGQLRIASMSSGKNFEMGSLLGLFYLFDLIQDLPLKNTGQAIFPQLIKPLDDEIFCKKNI